MGGLVTYAFGPFYRLGLVILPLQPLDQAAEQLAEEDEEGDDGHTFLGGMMLWTRLAMIFSLRK